MCFFFLPYFVLYNRRYFVIFLFFYILPPMVWLVNKFPLFYSKKKITFLKKLFCSVQSIFCFPSTVQIKIFEISDVVVKLKNLEYRIFAIFYHEYSLFFFEIVKTSAEIAPNFFFSMRNFRMDTFFLGIFR